MSSISVVIPVFRSAPNLRDLVHSIRTALDLKGDPYEIILVEDCGGDNSWDIIFDLTLEFDELKGIKLSRNFGQHNALLCGIRTARHEMIITMDDDGQHPPEEISNLLDKINSGFDVVYATPNKENHSRVRNLASVTIKKILQNLMGVESATKVSAFRAFRTELRDAFENFSGPMVNIDIMLTWATTNFSSIEVERPSRIQGESGYSLGGLLNHAINMITGFSGVPLRIASYIGIIFAVIGGLILLYILTVFAVSGPVVPGFAFLASLITIFSGVQLLTIGVIGEYVARIHFRSMDRPPYVVKHISVKKRSND